MSAPLEVREPAGDRPVVCPALLRPFLALDRTRHAYPLVLQDGLVGAGAFRPLSELLDAAMDGMPATGGSLREQRRDARALERWLRAATHGSDEMTDLRSCAERATSALVEEVGSDPERAARRRLHLDALRALLPDGRLLACTEASAALVATHLFLAHEGERSRAQAAEIARLRAVLGALLRADFASSAAATKPAALRAVIGSSYASEIDFERMAATVARRPPAGGLSARRADRLRAACDVLESQRWFAADARKAVPALHQGWIFDGVGAALAAWKQRLPELGALAKALAVARLEAAGAYDEAVHDPFFATLDAAALVRLDPALAPSILVRIEPERFDASERALLPDLLGSDLPMKVLVTTDSPFVATPAGDYVLGAWSGRLALLAVGLGSAPVVQTTSSMLAQDAHAIAALLERPGPALVSVYTGSATAAPSVPLYLQTAAAHDARVFPSFVFDPEAPPGERLVLGPHPDAGEAWPRAVLAYEDPELQAVREQWALTPVELLAADLRFAKHFELLPPARWSDAQEPAADWLCRSPEDAARRTPFVWLLDSADVLLRAIPGPAMMAAARSCAAQWSRLRELAAARATERKPVAAREVAVAPAPAHEVAAPPPAVLRTADPGDAPWIETSRCTSCNECVGLDAGLFAYDENLQAILRDPDAGPYRHLVEAAERCRVAIIHPGEPRDPNEPDLEALRVRAAPFR